MAATAKKTAKNVKSVKKASNVVSIKKGKIKVETEKVKAEPARLISPWGRNSTEFKTDMSVKDMLVESGLDWTVERYPLQVNVDGEMINVGEDALLRSDNNHILSTASTQWNHFDNEVAVEFMDKFARSIGNRVNFLGQVRGGRLVFGLSELKGEKFALFKGKDEVSSYLLLSNPHVYGQKFDVRFTAIRDRCYNTLTQGLSRNGDLEVRISHRKKFDPAFAEQALIAARGNMKKYQEMSELLASKRFSEDTLIEYYHTVFPTLSNKKGRDPKKLSRPGQMAFDVLETQPGAELGEGTWWQVYNSATYALDHLVGRSPDNRLYASWYGLNRAKKNQALRIACEFAQAA